MLCLRINRGLSARVADLEWLKSQARKSVVFFESDLAPHFKAEEEVLFPSMRDISSAAELIAALLEEHLEVKRLANNLRSGDKNSIAETLTEFARLLEAHIRKEERELFPIYETEITGSVAQQVEHDIVAAIGTALEPKNPELLEP